MPDQKKQKDRSFKRRPFVDGIFVSEESEKPEKLVEPVVKKEVKSGREGGSRKKEKREQPAFLKKGKKQFSLIWQKDHWKRSFFEDQPTPSRTNRLLNWFKSNHQIDRPKIIKTAVVGFFLLFFLCGTISLSAQAEKIRGQVSGVAVEGRKHLTLARKAVDEMDIIQATEEFGRASREIKRANQTLGSKGQISLYWSQLPYIKGEEHSLVNFLTLIDQSLDGAEKLFSQLEGLVGKH